jgi:predicted metal-dependent phosphotriesterase family hydrolase
MAKVRTVAGDVAAGQLGPATMHEHIFGDGTRAGQAAGTRRRPFTAAPHHGQVVTNLTARQGWIGWAVIASGLPGGSRWRAGRP